MLKNRRGFAQNTRTLAAGVASLILLLSVNAASAEEPTLREQVQRANKMLQDGKVDEALAQYQTLTEKQPDRAALAYNQAVAMYRKGDYQNAGQLLEKSLTTRDHSLEAKARFNLGNCSYADAVKLVKEKPKDAIKKLEKAITHYGEALGVAPDDTDTRANIELAQLLIDKLKEQQKQDKKKNQDKKQDKKQDQKKEQDKNQDKKQDQKKGQDKNQDKKQEQKKDQDKNQDKKQEQKKDQDKKEDKKQEQQKKQEKQQDQKKNQQGSDDQTGQPKDADHQPSGKPRPMTLDEAKKMLQAVRDKDHKRRAEKVRRMRAYQVPVERDW